MVDATSQSASGRRQARRSGPVFTGLKIAWWLFAVAVVGPILIGVIRGTF